MFQTRLAIEPLVRRPLVFPEVGLHRLVQPLLRPEPRRAPDDDDGRGVPDSTGDDGGAPDDDDDDARGATRAPPRPRPPPRGASPNRRRGGGGGGEIDDEESATIAAEEEDFREQDARALCDRLAALRGGWEAGAAFVAPLAAARAGGRRGTGSVRLIDALGDWAKSLGGRGGRAAADDAAAPPPSSASHSLAGDATKAYWVKLDGVRWTNWVPRNGWCQPHDARLHGALVAAARDALNKHRHEARISKEMTSLSLSRERRDGNARVLSVVRGCGRRLQPPTKARRCLRARARWSRARSLGARESPVCAFVHEDECTLVFDGARAADKSASDPRRRLETTLAGYFSVRFQHHLERLWAEARKGTIRGCGAAQVMTRGATRVWS